MATIVDPGFPTIVNVVNSLRPDGKVEQSFANTLTKKMPILNDIPWVQGNLPTGHRINSITGLPSPAWRQLNAGVAPGKGSSLPYDETCGIMELPTRIDVDMAKMSGDPASYRMREEALALEGFNQEFCRALFYEDVTVHPERFHGLAVRYPATSGYTASNYVLKGTNSGSNCHSIYLIGWDQDKVGCIYPLNSMAGLLREDKGEQKTRDANGNEFWVYETRFQWKAGLMVKDYRQVVRYQWDPDDSNFASTAKGLYLALTQMLSTIYDLQPSARLYMDRTSFTLLQQQLVSNSLNALEYINDGGGLVAKFMGVAIRLSDSLVQESAIS